MKTALATERGKNATCDTTHCRGKYRFLQFLSDIPAPHELQSEGGEVGKAKELRSWRPRSGSPGTLEGPRQARPFPGGVAPPHTWVLEILLTHLELARAHEPRISRPRSREGSVHTSSGPARRRAECAGAELGSAAGRGPTGNRLPPTQGRSRVG